MFAVADGVHVAMAPVTGPIGESVAARNLLRRLLTEVAGPGAAASEVASRHGGQPFLPRRPDLAVSLSHSSHWVAAAVGIQTAVGVDVQVPQPTPAGLLRRCCGARTREMLACLPADRRDVEFAWIWTAQEACVKATGQGIGGLPWTIPVEAGQRAGTWHGVSWRALRDRSRIPLSCAYREVTR